MFRRSDSRFAHRASVAAEVIDTSYMVQAALCEAAESSDRCDKAGPYVAANDTDFTLQSYLFIDFR